MAGLLFLAFAYFAVAQATVNRSDAQGAADAAALAAANDARVQISKELLDEDLDPADLEDLIAGEIFTAESACAEAEKFAGKNDAISTACDRLSLPQQGFEVRVTTRRGVGSSVIPGVENRKSTAAASAVIEPRCALKKQPDDVGDPVELSCAEGDLVIDLKEGDPLPDLADLFMVRLVE